MNRQDIFQQFPWLEDQQLPMIISTDVDGLLSAAWLHHYLGWRLEGFYDCETLWVTPTAEKERARLVWVDLDICDPYRRCIGHHVLTLTGALPESLAGCCNPNLLLGVGADTFDRKYPFSTILFLLWLFDAPLRRDLAARLLVLHADSVWMTVQRYPENVRRWRKLLPGYDWQWLFQRVDTELFEQRMQEQLYARLERLEAFRPGGQAVSRHLRLQGGQLRFNPDWDGEVVLRLGDFIGTHLKWSPPRMPAGLRRVEGKRRSVPLTSFAAGDFPAGLIRKGAFSYAITGTDSLNFTRLRW